MVRWAVVFLLLLLTACSSGSFKVSGDEYRQRVKTLGVLPLLVDDSSDIVHPRGDKVVRILRSQNREKEGRLIEILKQKKAYFDVRPVTGMPAGLFDRLITGSSPQGPPEEIHREYRFDAGAVAELARSNVVDALLVVVQNGVMRTEKRWGRLHLSYLEADYSQIVVSAAIVDPSGRVLWEYASASGEPFLQLQYPDFDEAYYNKTETVNVKFITTAGLERTLAESGRSLFERTPFPLPYRDLFAAIDSALDLGLLNPFANGTGK